MNKNTAAVSAEIKASAHKKAASHIDILDGFRGIAIIMVMLLHIWELTWFPFKFRILNREVNLEFLQITGFLGVALFFFISGFCLFYPYARHLFEGKELQTLRQYIYKRCIKIFPSYYLSIILILVFVGQNFDSLKTAVKHIVFHVLFIHNLFQQTEGTINGVYWSLGVEIQFYLIFPLICWLFRKRPFITYAVLLILANVYRYYVAQNYQDKFIFMFNQLPGFIDFFAGGMLAAYLFVLIKNRINVLEKLVPLFTALAITLFLIFLSMLKWLYDIRYSQNAIPIWQTQNRYFLSVIFIFLVIASAFSHKVWSSFIANRLFVFMSVISYNLYIWHQLIAVQMLKYKIPMPGTPDPHNDPKWQVLFTLVSIAVSIAFTALITYAFERPLLKNGIRKTFKQLLSIFRGSEQMKKASSR